MPDHLEAAAEAVYGDPKPEEPPQSVTLVPAAWERWIVAEAQAGRAVTAYLDSLLGDLPQEAVEAGAAGIRGENGSHPYGHEYGRYYGPDTLAKFAIRAALHRLRDSVAPTDAGVGE